MNIFNNFYNKKTDYKAGYLNFSFDTNHPKCESFSSPKNFIAPRKLDFRDMCLYTSDQSTTPHCAGYSTAGFIEILNWKNKHYPEQIDGDLIYKKAKELEGTSYDGTTLQHATKAAIDLKLIEGKQRLVSRSRDSLKFSIHKFNSCIGGFMITNEWNHCNTRDGRIPTFNKTQNLGGHAVLCVGYDEEGIYVQNSWGINWGLYGFCLLNWELFDKQFIYGMVIE